MTRVLSLCFAIVFLITAYSCSSEDTKSSTDEEPIADIIITSEIATTTNIADDPNDDDWTIRYTTPLDENKYTTTTQDFFVNDMQTSSTTGTEHFYNNDGFLTNKNTPNNFFSREYFYDINNTLVGANLHLSEGAVNYYRFSSQSNNIYFQERITLPYSDPGTEILTRYIVELNNDEFVIKTGIDTDFDGIAEHERTFTYSAEGDLLTATDENQTITITYSNIIDTANYIEEQMLGQRNISIIHGEAFSSLPLTEIANKNHSYHITSSEAALADFEVNEAGFYTLKTYTDENTGDYTRMRSVMYIFE